MINKILILIAIVLYLSCLGEAQEVEIQKCSVPKGIGGKYKLVSEARPLGKNKEIGLYVVIKPKNFTKKYMTEFAKRVESQYCEEDIILVSIFDDEKAVQGWHYDWVISAGKIDKRRGTYLLNRKTGEEGIEFSTKPGNPVNEIRIELSKALK